MNVTQKQKATPPPEMLPILDAFRRQQWQAVLDLVDRALPATADRCPLLAIAGLAASRLQQPDRVISYLTPLLQARPDDRSTRKNLATALLATGALDDALALADGHKDAELLKIVGYVHQEHGRTSEAITAYEAAVAMVPEDYESWNNLGNVRASVGDLDSAVTAFEQAISWHRDDPHIYCNLSEALSKLRRWKERQYVMREAARIAPDDADVQIELGMAEATARDFDAAEAALRKATRLRPSATAAFVELGLLYENLNRIDAMDGLVAEAAAAKIDEGALNFLRAWSLRRQNRFDEAMILAEPVPATIHPVRRAQLVGELADRLGQTDLAYNQFTAMNDAAIAMAPPLSGLDYQSDVEGHVSRLTAEALAAWNPVEIDTTTPPPIFIVGFPRSGTTLLDTLLMNLPQLHVLEEQPVLRRVELALGDGARLGALTSEQANALRGEYFSALADIAPMPNIGMTIVDKHPLNMTRMALINRIFPDAKVVMVERHPCDAVLSCFMSNFQLNHAMRCFVTLEGAAKLYDSAFTAWTRATTLLPQQTHTIGYESMIEDLESQMRSLLGFLGIDWDANVLDNIGAASKRDHIHTASYAQVTEPIYRRSLGRWHRYRAHMESVLPILKPWAEKMAYAMD